MAASPAIQFMPFWEYFQTFVPAQRVNLELRACHQEICELYQAAILGQMPGYEYFLVNMPRRTGKTKILQALPTWMIGEFWDSQMLYGSYSTKLVTETVAYARDTINKPWYRDIYGRPETALKDERADHITTHGGASLYGAGMLATIAGFGAGLKEPAGGFIALDDPANPAEALSVAEQENTVESLEMTWKGCRNSDRFCPIFCNSQRIGPVDLPGYIKETYPDKTYTLKIPCFISGRSQFPDAWSDSTHESLSSTRTGRFVLASQFQQEPIAFGGNLIPIDDFVRWDADEATSMKFEKLIIAVDTALKTKQANDFSAAALWGLLDRRAYLIDVVHGKWETPELIKNITAFWEKWKHLPGWPQPRLIIEEKASGTPLLQTLKTRGIPATGIERDQDKVRRVQNILPYIETHMVLIPQDSPGRPWLAKWLREHSQFAADGSAPHDDLCLVAGTLVTCGRGQIPIEHVRAGDKVLTRAGWQPVEWAGQTGVVTNLVTVTAGNRSITGTAGHRIWTAERGFVPLDSTTEGMTFLTNAASARSYSDDPRPTFAPMAVSSVQRIATTQPVPVFNLKVTGQPEFFANGLLVHNCDTTADSVWLLLGRKLTGWDVLLDKR